MGTQQEWKTNNLTTIPGEAFEDLQPPTKFYSTSPNILSFSCLQLLYFLVVIK